jgi:Spy/CpxP family protein refolding chaperone
MFRSLLLAAALIAFSPLASQAQTGHWPMDRAWAQQGQGQRQGNPGRQREAGRNEQDRRNAMSPEERRELNRDLQRANREIYRKGKERPQRH